MLYPQISYYFLEYKFLLSSIITELSTVTCCILVDKEEIDSVGVLGASSPDAPAGGSGAP